MLALALLLHTAGFAQVQPSSVAQREAFTRRLVAADQRPRDVVRFNPAYVSIPYPGGDVPANTGVCTDEIIRIYRAVGVALQKVHEDMQANFWSYPNHVRLDAFYTDTNIDSCGPKISADRPIYESSTT